MNLSELADYLDKTAKELPMRSNEAAKAVAREIVETVAYGTPADVGTAISNWQARVGSPADAAIDAFEPSPKGRMRGGVWTHTVDPLVTTAANAPVTVAEAEIAIEQKQPGQPLFLTNVLPYSEKLNEGSSKQAPAGYVDEAVLKAQRIVDGFKFV